MPWDIVRVDGGWKVQNKHTKKFYSKKPMTKIKAKRQLAALHANTDESIDPMTLPEVIAEMIEEDQLEPEDE